MRATLGYDLMAWGEVVFGHSSDPLGLSEMVGTSFSQSSVQYLELLSSILFSLRKRILRFLLDAFIQGLVYAFNTVPVDTGVRRELLQLLTSASHQVVCRHGYIR